MAAEITLRLDNIDHLFNAPAYDLLSSNARDVSGMESILEELTPKTLRGQLKLVLYLPAQQIDADLHMQVKHAVKRYTEHKIRSTERQLSAQRRRSFRSLQIGLVFLGVCLLLAALAEAATFLPHWLGSFLNNGFTIIGWVSLWHPAEALLFDWWPFWRDKHLYKAIAVMEIQIKALDTSS